MAGPKPKGSGWFAIGSGILFLVALVCSFIWDLSQISPYAVFKAWLAIASLILLGWGINRVLKGRDEWTIGQPTINFVVGIVGATIAILAIVVSVP